MGKDLTLSRRRRSGRAGRARARRVTIVAARFNEAITRSLMRSARQALQEGGVPKSHITEVWVPGAFELPVAAACIAGAQRPDAIVALGCLIKGETPQYEAIGHAVAQGLTQVAVESKIPVAFGVIIAETKAQARARAGGTARDRGREAAQAALELLDALQGMTAGQVIPPEEDG